MIKNFLSVSMAELSTPKRRNSATYAVSHAFRDIIAKEPNMPCSVRVRSISNFAVLAVKFTPFIGPTRCVRISFFHDGRKFVEFEVFFTDDKLRISSDDSCEADKTFQNNGKIHPNSLHRISVKQKDELTEISIDDVPLTWMDISYKLSEVERIEVSGDVNVTEISSSGSRRRQSRSMLREGIENMKGLMP